MRRSTIALMLVLFTALAVSTLQGATDEALLGRWGGTYEGGGGAGTYAITLSHDEAKTLTGTLEVMPEGGGGGYSTPFKSVETTETGAVLTYDSPEGDAEVQIDIIVEGASLKGTWKAIDPSSNAVVAEGTLTGTKE